MFRSSAIFNAQKQALKTVDAKAERDSDAEEEGDMLVGGHEKVDLTIEQTQINDDEGLEEMDDFDLLDASIDPTDVKSLERRHELEAEIEYE